jgi:hypothetical protein
MAVSMACLFMQLYVQSKEAWLQNVFIHSTFDDYELSAKWFARLACHPSVSRLARKTVTLDWMAPYPGLHTSGIWHNQQANAET